MPLTRVSYPYADALTVSNASIGSLFTTSQTFASSLTVQPRSTTAVSLIVIGSGSQSADILQVKNSSGTNLVALSPNSQTVFPGVTTTKSALSINANTDFSSDLTRISGKLTVGEYFAYFAALNIQAQSITEPSMQIRLKSGTNANVIIVSNHLGIDVMNLSPTGQITAAQFIRNGGVASQFLKADGSVDNSTYLTANQSISLSGDVTGTGTTAITTTLANSGVTIGTYKSVTVDVKGRVTAGTNPTTLSGYGITDALDTSATAQTKSGNLTVASIIRSGGTSSQFLKADGSVDSSTYLTTGTASTTYAALSGATFTGAINGTSLTLSGDLTVNGTTTNINTTNLVVEDKNIVLGDVATPSTTTADGGGLTLLAGGTNKTFNWVNATDRWTSNVGLEGTSFVRTGGTASQFLKADGTVDSSTYLTSASALTAGNLSGTIPSAVLGNSSVFIGTTSIALNRGTGALSLTGVSVDGSAGSVAAANITGTTLAAGVTASSLTSVGTLTSLTTSGAINLNYASPAITSNNASAASIFTSNVTGVTIGSSTIRTTEFPADGTTTTAAAGAGYMGMPQIIVSSGGRTLAITDAGKHIYVTTTSAQTITIPANGTVAFPIGTTIVIVNGNAITTSIAITTDTLRLANSTSTGTRTLASNSMCTLLKIGSTEWLSSGNGLT